MSTTELLRDAGLRVTASRVAVLDALERAPHSAASHVFDGLGDEATSIQSVHNALTDLTAAGILRRIEPAGSAALYELRTGDNHHHLVCTSCNAVTDVDCVVGHAPCLHPSDAAGYRIEVAEVTFWGLCPTCATATASR
jgi:Fur family ferric uptake transcriptional regulator